MVQATHVITPDAATLPGNQVIGGESALPQAPTEPWKDTALSYETRLSALQSHLFSDTRRQLEHAELAPREHQAQLFERISDNSHDLSMLAKLGVLWFAISDLGESAPDAAREYATEFLRANSTPDANRVLCQTIGMLGSRPREKVSAASALHGTTDPAALQWLCETGLTNFSVDTRLASAYALKQTTCPACRAALQERIDEDPDELVRSVAQQSLK